MKKYLMEGIGTFFLSLSFILTISIQATQGLAPLAIGVTLIALSIGGSYLSGAHYNPAVSLAAFIQGKLERFDFPYYWLAQFVGGSFAAFIASFLLHCSANTEAPLRSPDGFCALIAEFLGAFLLNLTVLAVGHYREANSQPAHGLAVGLAQTSGMFMFGSISGGFFNPAVVTSLCITGIAAWGDWWLYTLGALLGAVAALSVFRILFSESA